MTTYYRVGTGPERVEWDPKTEASLHRKAKAPGGGEARKEFIGMFLLYAAEVGQRAAGGRLRQDDTISAANRGLARAVDRWKPDGRSRFSTFARKFIRGAVLSEVRRQSIYSARHVSFDDPNVGFSHDDREELRQDSPSDVPDLVREAGGELLKRVMSATLTPRERRMVNRKFKLGWTYEQIAEAEGLTRQRIKQIVSKAMDALRTAYGPKFRRKLRV